MGGDIYYGQVVGQKVNVSFFYAAMVERAKVFWYSARSLLRCLGWRRFHSPCGKLAVGCCGGKFANKSLTCFAFAIVSGVFIG